MDYRLVNVTLAMPDRLVGGGALQVRDGRILAAGPADAMGAWKGETRDGGGMIAAAGFVDLHVHGGGGADFMDATPAAFEVAVAAHARRGTTTLVPTSTAGRHEQTLAFLETCRRMKHQGADAARGLARVAGAHLYGPYFAEEKVGCHPRQCRAPAPSEYEQYLDLADVIVSATCAPELPGATGFYRAAAARGVRLNAGHSNASWDEMQCAYDAGVRHVDHLFCAMSNYVSLRARFGPPMRGGIFEFTMATPGMTTEVIADGRHLAPELLRFALQVKGADRLALVTDCSRALDMPTGQYVFGPADGGEPFHSDGEVGLTIDRAGLASSVRGMDHMVRHLHRAAAIELPTALRMASLTPARVIGLDHDIGSLEPGKRADFILLDADLEVRAVFVDGQPLHSPAAPAPQGA